MTETEPITDAESLCEQPQAFDPPEQDGPTATIVYSGGSEVVEDFFHIEERMDATDPYGDMPDDEVIPVVRVWYTNPSLDDSDYVDYDYGTITEVTP